MANDNEKQFATEALVRSNADAALAARISAIQATLDTARATIDPIPANDKPEIASRPSFLTDVRNGLVHVAKTLWQVPEARGYIATLIVRIGVPAGISAILIPLIDALVK